MNLFLASASGSIEIKWVIWTLNIDRGQVVVSLFLTDLIYPTVDLGTLAVVLVSLYYVHRQSIVGYIDAKIVLVFVHVFFAGVMVFEFLRNFLSTPEFVAMHTVVSATLVLWDVILLSSLSSPRGISR